MGVLYTNDSVSMSVCYSGEFIVHECSGVVGEVTRNMSAGLCSVHKHFLMVDTIDVLGGESLY